MQARCGGLFYWEMIMSKRLTTEEFTRRAKENHGNSYDYTKTVYLGQDKHIQYYCKKCKKDHWQNANSHIKHGCTENSKTKLLTTKKFVKRAKDKFGDMYDYSIVNYKGHSIKVKIKCNKCGKIKKIKPSGHLSSRRGGCSFCYGGGSGSNKDEFIEKASRIYPSGHYNYDKFIYVSANTRGIVHCNIHNFDFQCHPNSHLSVNPKTGLGCGCPKCGREKVNIASRKTFSVFINQSRDIHGDSYEYDPDSYKGVKAKMNIYCYKHGWFKLAPDQHINAKIGCQKCSTSHGEKMINTILEKTGIKFKWQFKIKKCKNSRPLPFDFAVLNKKGLLKGLIEFHGRQHYKFVPYFHKTANIALDIQRNDQIKSDFCALNKIPLLVIPYTKINNIEEEINCFLKKIKNKRAITKFNSLFQLNIFQI